MGKRKFHLSDCPVLAREVWDDEDVAVAMDWALALGYEDAAGRRGGGRYYWQADRPPWTDYEPAHVQDALANDVDPFVWNPEVEAEFEYSGMGDYYGGHSTKEGQALLYASYGFDTTVGDLVDEWMSELTMGFPGEDDPRWEHLSDEQIKKALESVFVTPYNPDAIFDEDMEAPEDEDDDLYESPVAIVLLTVTTGGLKDG